MKYVYVIRHMTYNGGQCWAKQVDERFGPYNAYGRWAWTGVCRPKEASEFSSYEQAVCARRAWINTACSFGVDKDKIRILRRRK